MRRIWAAQLILGFLFVMLVVRAVIAAIEEPREQLPAPVPIAAAESPATPLEQLPIPPPVEVDIEREEAPVRVTYRVRRAHRTSERDARELEVERDRQIARGTLELFPLRAHTPDPVQGISEISPGRYEVDATKCCGERSTYGSSDGSACSFGVGPRVVPVFRDGVAIGMKLFSIPKDSALDKLGLRDRDVITRVNGRPLDTPEHALELYAHVRDARLIEVELERDGAPVRLAYEVKRPG